MTPGQPLVRTARIEHTGEFRSGLDAPWSPFTSVEHFAVKPPGFVWDAAIRMSPLMTVRVRDSYLQATPARYRDVNGKGVPTPWAGYFFRGYERMGG